jgi:lipoteichoic acid synthase
MRRLAPLLVVLAAIGLAVVTTVLRAVQVQRSLGASVVCDRCFILQVVQSDLWLVGLVAALGALALFVNRRSIRVALSMLMFLVVAVMAADVLTFRSLAVRLYVGDIGKFGGEVSAINKFLMVYFEGRWPWILALVLGGAVALVALAASCRERRGGAAAALLAVAALCAATAAAGLGADQRYVHDESVRNWFAINLDQGVSRPYSEAFAAAATSAIVADAKACQSGQTARPDIVLVVVESLSSYHSELLGGRGWTPELDEIARRNAWFTNFHANGFTTDHGLIALLAGKDPLPAVGRYGSSKAYDGFADPHGTLPTVLKARGYSTLFFTTGDLGFLDKGRWCTAIGFDHVEGAEARFYEGMDRLHFNAAPDEALFGRFLQWYAGRDPRRPFFASLLTVSSHPPFIEPQSRQHGEEAVIRYVDRQLGSFHRELEAAGFFDNGLLLITGDHRAMTPVTAPEAKRFGERALSRVPLVVAGRSSLGPGRHDALAQQADLVDSLGVALGDEYCRNASRGTFLTAPPVEPRFVIHVRGDRRSWLSVYMAQGDSIVRLDGDRTGWLGTAPANGESIVRHVNMERIRLGQAQQDAVEYMIRLRAGPAKN